MHQLERLEQPLRINHTCRQAGVQLGSVDAALAQLAIANSLELLTKE